MITITFVRHGQSTDNLKVGMWAGWADAPLSDHGMKQAAAVGHDLASYHITHIFSSDLQRAHSTAQAIYEAQPDPKPPLTVTQLLRERHWGDAEGKIANPPWLPLEGRDSRFKNGESMNDVAQRGDLFFDQYLAPIIKEAKGKPLGEINLIVASHGVAIAENIGALLRRSTHVEGDDLNGTFMGLLNTAWTRVIVGLDGETIPRGYDSNTLTEDNTSPAPDQGAILTTKIEAVAPPPLESSGGDRLAIRSKVVARNQHSHLKSLETKLGEIDPVQQTMQL